MCVLLILLPTQNRDLILRNTFLNNSPRCLRFLFRMLRTSTIFVLGCSPNYYRAFRRYLFLMKDISHVSSNLQAVTTAVLPSCPFSSTCVTPGISRRTRPEGEPSHIHITVFFFPFGIPFSSGRGSFLMVSAPWHAGSPSGPRNQVWALAKVRGTCCGVQSGKSARGGIPST